MTRNEAGLPAQARTLPDAVALRIADARHSTLSYAELDDRARRAAHALVALGVGEGDRVAVMLPNSAEWFEAVHGCGRLGAIAVPINVHFKAAETGWIVSDSGAKAAVVHGDLLPALADTPDVARLVVGGEGSYDAALADAPDDDPFLESGGDCWPTTMVYTSGTTGKPKGVAIAEGDFRRSAAGMAAMGQRWNFGPGDVHLLAGPIYHSGPQAWAQSHLAFGGTVVVMPRWDAEECLALVERYRVTNTHLVPANFIRILELPEATRKAHELSSLRLVVHAAAPCPVPVKRAFMDLVGPDKVWEYYGASEGGGTFIGPQEWLEHPGSVGRPAPGNEFKIVDERGNELPPGEVGEIYVRSETTGGFRYHNDDEKTAAAYDGEWFSVGDVGYRDDDGYLYLVDRKGDMLISGGVNVYPREIEDTLVEHPDVVDCAVLGLPDERWGEIVCAVVEPRTDSGLDADAITAWCRERLADYKAPRRIEFVDRLPRDPNGKVAKHCLPTELIDR